MDQRSLERKQVEMGKKRYLSTVERARDRGQMAETKAGMTLTQEAVEPTAQAIKDLFWSPGKVKQRHLEQTAQFLSKFDPKLIAFFTARRCVNSYQHPVTFTKAAAEIGQMLEDHADYMRFKEEDKEHFRLTERRMKKCTHYRHRKRVFKHFQKVAEVPFSEWSHADKVKMGMRLIELFASATGFVEIRQLNKGKKDHTRLEVVPTPLFEGLIKEKHRFCALLAPYYLPMVTEPKDWSNLYNGGYIKRPAKGWKLVKSHNQNYLTELAQNPQQMEEVFKAINILQKTPWRINQRVLEVMDYLWESGGGPEVGLPKRDDVELPLCPICKGRADGEGHECFENLEDKTLHKAWKKEAAMVHAENIRVRSKRIAQAQKLMIAEKFKAEGEIFFPYQLDWRGRVYPAPIYVNPQADDTGRGLIEFAHGKPLGETGLRWLKIHAANCFGEDKVSLDDREKWADDHAEQIVACAENPYDNRWWADADKPYQFLAVVFELADYWQAVAQGIEGLFESRIPCAIDGSCNGLQNYSAMLRDPDGAKATNLIPDDLPNDIYMDVAEEVWKRIWMDAENKDSEDHEEAKLWETVSDPKMRRKLVKRNVMTMPYSATQRGMCEQLNHEIMQLRDKGHRVIDIDDPWRACHYLARLNYESIRAVVPAAANAMDWLKKVASVAAKQGVAINWETPMGYRVQQRYVVPDILRVETIIGGLRLQPAIYQNSDEINTRKMAQAIAPNFIHSMDAAHLMATVIKAHDSGIKAFGMVHDSYASYACDMDVLSATLRECFVDQYSENILLTFRENILGQVAEKNHKDIPDCPDVGNLDLSVIIDSLYFFA